MDQQATDLALQFANHLIAQQFDHAQQCLSQAAQQTWSAEALSTRYSSMVSYFRSAPHRAEVVETLTDWPAKSPGDIGWAYVSIEGDSDCEAVIVIVGQDSDRWGIRDIEWGRP
jgi:hypothetical protein